MSASANLGQWVVFSDLDALVPYARLTAERGVFDGRQSARNQRIIQGCTHKVRIKRGLVASVLYTRNIGHHSSGWWKNPDYERCKHLSLAFLEDPGFARLPFQRNSAEDVSKAFFGDDVRKTWFEPAYSEEGKACDVGHYRLFCDAGWNPIKPRGEVYSRELTEAGWKSFSDLHGDEDRP